MKNPVETWTYLYIEFLRRQSACINIQIVHIFSESDRQQAIAKLQTFYPEGRINPSFADRVLYLSEIY